MIKIMNCKMTTNPQLSTNETKKKKKNPLNKQLEKEQNQRNRYHMEGYQQGGGVGRMREKVKGIGSINGRYNIDRGRLRMV